MNLHEYEAKATFAKYGVPTPVGGAPAKTAAEARAIAERLGGKAIVKALVSTGGRGKAGGVKLAKSADEAEAAANAILGMDIKGFTVERVLVDPLAPGGIETELYLSVLIDRAMQRPMIMASAAGGMDIEAVAEDTPDKIIKVHVDPSVGLNMFQSYYIAERMELPRELWKSFHKICASLYDCFMSSDASLCEINPLVITGEGELMALDGKMSVDDNAKYRQPEILEIAAQDDTTDAEKEAVDAGITFIQLDGNIGCLVNGAGLAMTTMDVIKLFGGDPANFLDIGGGAKAEKVVAALKLILADKDVKAVLVNIFGGITRGDEVAKGMIEALEIVDTDVPFVVRIAGTNAKEGMALLEGTEMETAVTLAEAAQKAVAAAERYAGGGDDLTKIEGIGPKMAEALSAAGLSSFAKVAGASADQIKDILTAAEGKFGSANPATWPQQAQLAADGKWDELKKWQDELDGGRA